MTKIYTKTGDCGTTGTYSMGRMSKGDQLAAVLGSLDEVNSVVGVCIWTITNYQLPITKQFSNTKFKIVNKELRRIQNNLMTISSGLAGSKKRLKPGEVIHLEKLIDKLSEEIPTLNKFIYPVGWLQYARAVVRRAERETVMLNNQIPSSKIQINSNVLKYLNRLSDTLFVMGRWVNHKMGVEEEKWENDK